MIQATLGIETNTELNSAIKITLNNLINIYLHHIYYLMNLTGN